MRRKKRAKVIVERFTEEKDEGEAEILPVISAVPLLPSQQREIENIVTQSVGGKFRIENRVDQSVIGGLYIKIGERVIDATLRAKIEKLKERLLP